MAHSKSCIYWNSPDLVKLREEISFKHPILRSKKDIINLMDLAYAFDEILNDNIMKYPYIDTHLKDEIRDRCNKVESVLSVKTIKRLYGEDKAYKSMFEIDTLDFFAIVGGYLSWDNYLNTKLNPNGQYFSLYKAKSSLMEIGQLYIIGWYPHKYVKLLYLGDNQFRIIDSSRRGVYAEDRIIKADSFDFRHIMELDSLGYPLYPSIFYINNEEEILFDFDSVE